MVCHHSPTRPAWAPDRFERSTVLETSQVDLPSMCAKMRHHQSLTSKIQSGSSNIVHKGAPRASPHFGNEAIDTSLLQFVREAVDILRRRSGERSRPVALS